MPGTTDLPRRSMRCVLGPASRFTSAFDPTATMREPRTATAWAIWKVSLRVMIFPLKRMRSEPACCACSDNESPTTPPNSSSHAHFLITPSSWPGSVPVRRLYTCALGPPCSANKCHACTYATLGFIMWRLSGNALCSMRKGAEAMMRTVFYPVCLAFLVVMLVVGARTAAQSAFGDRAAETSASALTGVVSSQAEGPMGGVVVSAGRGGSSRTVRVLPDGGGRYAFPPSRLEGG